MRVLVTGSSGYIGSRLVGRLVEQGHEVVGLDLGLFERHGFGTRLQSADRRDIRNVKLSDVEGFHAVVALAALSNDPLGDLQPRLTYEINHVANVEMARLAREAGVERFLFASSCSLYGSSGGALVDETAELAPVTPYGHAKALVERDVAALADDEFSPVFLRNATVYGSSPALRLDVVVNNLSAWAVATDEIVLVSDGTPWRPQVHVDDVCSAVEVMLVAPREKIHGEAFNVGRTDQNFQVRELAEIVGEVVPSASVRVPESVDPDTRSYRVDFSKISETFPEFRPSWDVRSGVEQLASDFRAENLTEADFSHFTRLAQVKVLSEEGSLTDDLRWKS